MHESRRKLHLGCFDQVLSGWINTDITPHIFLSGFRVWLYYFSKSVYFHGNVMTNTERAYFALFVILMLQKGFLMRTARLIMCIAHIYLSTFIQNRRPFVSMKSIGL